MRKVPQTARELIRSYESLRLTAYDDKQPNRVKFGSELDVHGVPTIGWGSTQGVTKHDVVHARRISEADAEARFIVDLEEAEEKLYGVLPASLIDQLSEGEFGCLCAFAFNAGASHSMNWVKDLLAGHKDRVPADMSKYVYSGGQKMTGLVKRRAKEVALWNSKEESR